MKFEEVLPALKEGKKIKRKCMPYGYYHIKNDLILDEKGKLYIFGIQTDILEDDWEIIKAPKKVKLRDLTWEQYIKWVDNNCLEYNNYCDKCPFQKVKCEKDGGQNSLWINNKDLYSDKFLDQEIEVEE